MTEDAVDVATQDAINSLEDSADALWEAAEAWEGRRGTERLKAYSIVTRSFRDHVLRMKNSTRSGGSDDRDD